MSGSSRRLSLADCAGWGDLGDLVPGLRSIHSPEEFEKRFDEAGPFVKLILKKKALERASRPGYEPTEIEAIILRKMYEEID